MNEYYTVSRNLSHALIIQCVPHLISAPFHILVLFQIQTCHNVQVLLPLYVEKDTTVFLGTIEGRR